jgi:DNA processing protein
MTPHHYLHAFNCIPGIGAGTLRTLLQAFDTPEIAWNASESELAASGIGKIALRRLHEGRSAVDIAREWDILQNLRIRVILPNDPEYPPSLRTIPDAPVNLYVRGQLDITVKPLIAIVGSRKATPYGIRVAETLAEELSAAGFGIVSGLAFGIDTSAHHGTLRAKGATIAVLGNGLADEAISPQAQLPLAQALLEHGGALVSEYAPYTPAAPYTFPARNRIIAGMSLGTVVIEAAKRSGSLLTAHAALDYQREVFAVPGSIFSEASEGPHALLRSGAKLVGNIRDILEELQPNSASFAALDQPTVPMSPAENTLWSLLSHEPLHIDKIVKNATLPTSSVQSTLAFLEIKGLVKNIGGMHYVRSKQHTSLF